MHVTDLRNPTLLLSLDVDINVTRKSRHISAAVLSRPWNVAVKFHAVVVIEARTHDGQLFGPGSREVRERLDKQRSMQAKRYLFFSIGLAMVLRTI